MASRFRKMRTYHPRRSSKVIKLNKQKLIDLEHKISSDIGSLLVLMEEGSQEQIQMAAQKAKTDFLKFAPDMQKIASDIGGNFPRFVGEFLNSIYHILHSGNNWIDDAKVKSCYSATQKLESALLK
jgi:hypothetical protein